MPHDPIERARRVLKASLNGHDPDAPPEEQQGDSYQERLHQREQAQRNGVHAPPEASKEPRVVFPSPIPASELKKSGGQPWLWHGYLAPGAITLMSALWKAGKTTLLAHLLRAFEEGGEFCGRELSAAQVLYVTEESEHRWACRRDAIGLADHLSFLVRPFGGRADWTQWNDFILYLTEVLARSPASLVVFDPLVNLWPVRDENDNSQVLSALLPLQKLTDAGPSLLLVHHHRKGDGQEGTASRGAGALTGFVDTIIELRRYNPSDREDCKRVLVAYGRDDDTPEELVVELTADEGYVCHGSRRMVSAHQLLDVIADILPTGSPGITVPAILDNWPEQKPRRQRLLDALHAGAQQGLWTEAGDGCKGSPYRYWREESAEVPVQTPFDANGA